MKESLLAFSKLRRKPPPNDSSASQCDAFLLHFGKLFLAGNPRIWADACARNFWLKPPVPFASSFCFCSNPASEQCRSRSQCQHSSFPASKSLESSMSLASQETMCCPFSTS